MNFAREPVAGVESRMFPVHALFALYFLQSSGGSAFGGFSLLLPVLLIGMVLLTAIPNQRKQKKWNEQLSQLKSGDRVATTGGIRGTIVSLKDDVVVLRTQPDGIKLEFLKTAIASVTTEEEAGQ
ncbi:protein translocase subunit yajC [Terriglobus roseus]|uniref:Sec translocon accessory complex subunit YajC n=1 Tax=Terriglobus roseus TaxID=392734 RepID=A0A1G7PXM9_9BACT|nr:protein translocase subunit yajC [Terriglobus roseus]